MKFNSPVILFFKKGLLLLVLFLVLDFIAGSVLRYFYFKQKSGIDYQTIYSVERTNEEILFFGSSRSSHHYVPDVFSNKFSMSSYNTGRDGNFILYGYAVSKCILERYSPKLIILDISRKEFELKKGGYDYLSSLLPFFDSHPEIREQLGNRSKFEHVKLLLKSYPYNSLFPSIGLNIIRNKSKISYTNGYSPLNRKIERQSKFITGEKNYEVDPYLVETLHNFIILCRAKGVKLVVISSPYYDKYDMADPSLSLAKDICAKENVLFLDYSQDQRFTGNNVKFDDYHHLNDEAAREYSRICSDSISRILFKP